MSFEHPRQSKPVRTWWTQLSLVLALIVLASLSACSDDMMTADVEGDTEPQPSQLQNAETALADHRVDLARQLYADFLNTNPDSGTATAGLAITDLLLILEMTELSELLTTHLGAIQSIDANKLIYAEYGYLYWASRGARWDDDGEYLGIGTLIEDELPWTSSQLESVMAFVDQLDEPADKLVRQLARFANALEGIDYNLEAAIDDPNFLRLYVPGEVFYSSELSLRLGRSELSALRSMIALCRSALYFVAAYEHRWTPKEAFGEWRFDVDLTHPRFVSGFQPTDYTVDYLDEHLFRRVTNPDRLSASRLALRNALSYARDAIRYGVEEPSSTTLEWDDVDEDDAFELDSFLAAISASLDEPTVLPGSTPETKLDLSPFFSDQGRALNRELSWFYYRADEDSDSDDDGLVDGLSRWTVNEEAWQQFWLYEVFDPIPTPQKELDIKIGAEQTPGTYFEVLVGPYMDAFNNVYSGAN